MLQMMQAAPEPMHVDEEDEDALIAEALASHDKHSGKLEVSLQGRTCNKPIPPGLML